MPKGVTGADLSFPTRDTPGARTKAVWSTDVVQSSLDGVLARLYEEFDVPADRFLADEVLTDEFVERVYRSLGTREPDRREVMRRLVTLRKTGRLPRLRRTYRGRNS